MSGFILISKIYVLQDSLYILGILIYNHFGDFMSDLGIRIMLALENAFCKNSVPFNF